jgi:signal transduction histidine kinase
MLGAIGHYLRTPHATLRIRNEGMEPLEEREAAIRKIEEMSATLEDMLVLARSGRQRETARATDIAALVETLVDEYQDLGAPVSWHPSERVVLTVQANLLKRALRNLVDNAVKYGGSATLALAHQSDALAIAVTDQGPGIPTGQLERITEPFYRLESSRNRETGGTGLGLAIARAIAESHGGTLTLESTSSGLTASIRLPYGEVAKVG